MGFFSKPNPARNPPGAEGLAHHRTIQMPNGRDDLPLNRAMGESRSNGAPRIPGHLPGGVPRGGCIQELRVNSDIGVVFPREIRTFGL